MHRPHRIRENNNLAKLSQNIEKDLRLRVQNADYRHIIGISDCVAAALTTRSVNSSEWIVNMPNICTKKAQERRISRLLSHKSVSVPSFIKEYAKEIIQILARKQSVVVLMIDQSQVTEDRQCLMVSVRFGERALPVLWRVIDTKGAIGFDVQKEILDFVRAEIVPENTRILLSGDRFYGTKALVEWCQQAGWGYRLRLKGNLRFEHDGGEITAQEVGKLPGKKAINAKFANSEIFTNIGYLHEKEHPEAWIIAMDCLPSEYKVLDYKMRWGIENMFSDFKSRGFGITNTHLREPQRIVLFIC